MDAGVAKAASREAKSSEARARAAETRAEEEARRARELEHRRADAAEALERHRRRTLGDPIKPRIPRLSSVPNLARLQFSREGLIDRIARAMAKLRGHWWQDLDEEAREPFLKLAEFAVDAYILVEWEIRESQQRGEKTLIEQGVEL